MVAEWLWCLATDPKDTGSIFSVHDNTEEIFCHPED